MSSADRDRVLAGELIERLLVDPPFRAEFRRDPAAACLAAGLPGLADELTGSAGSIDTLAARESRSSLAGAVMAAAVEGMSIAEAQALVHHGLTGTPRGIGKLPHGGVLRGPLGHVHRAASPPVIGRELRGLHARSAPHGAADLTPHAAPSPPPAASSPPAAPAGPAEPAAAPASSEPATAAPGSSEPATAAPGSSGLGAAVPLQPGAGAPAPSEPAAPAPATPQPGAAAPMPSEPPPAAPPPPDPGAQPAHGGAVPVWPDQPSAGTAGGVPAEPPGAIGAVGSAGAAAASLLDSPQLSAAPDVRAFLTGGGADPRLVGVLNSTLASHSIGVGAVTSLSDPVHVQALTIVSVDGQPVGPNNFGARDLVTEIAALDPGQRPEQIGTPWPIHAPGFFTDPGQQGQIHLAFLTDEPQPASPGAVSPMPAETAVPAGAPPAAASPVAPEVMPAPAAAAPAAPEAAPAPLSAPSAGAPGHYVDPLPASARIGRTDMGVDANMNPGDAIVAPGTSRVLGIMPNWYQGQPYIGLQLLDGPMKGHNYYLAEQITPNVSVGQIVQQGQPIAHYAASGTGIEIGWAGSNWEQTLAQATSGYSEGEHTPAGASFRQFLDTVGHGATQDSSAAATGAGGRAPNLDANAGAGGRAPNLDANAGAGGRAPNLDANAGPDPDANAGPDPDANAGAGGRAPNLDANAGPDPDATAGANPNPTAGADPGAAPAAPNPAAGTPAPPSPAPFTVLESRHRGRVRHTVQFLPAVQPSPGSPLYGQAGGPAVGGAPVQPATGAGPPVGGAPAAAPSIAEPASPGALLEQASVASAPGGSISVSSSLLTPGQAKFAGRLAELTGLDPRVVAAWELAEESGGAARAREAATNFNWLNIGYFDSGAGKIAFDKTFGDPISAAEQSAKFLKGEWGGASPSIRAILNSVGHSPDEQMAAIANSDWASSHYGGGANLHGTFDELSDIRIDKSTVA